MALLLNFNSIFKNFETSLRYQFQIILFFPCKSVCDSLLCFDFLYAKMPTFAKKVVAWVGFSKYIETDKNNNKGVSHAFRGSEGHGKEKFSWELRFQTLSFFPALDAPDRLARQAVIKDTAQICH